MKHLLISAAGIFLAAQMAFAADSVISKDNSHAYLTVSDKPELIDLDLQAKTCKAIDLGKSFKQQVQAVTLSNAGFILCITKLAVWAYDPATGKCVKVCDAPKGTELDDIAYDPSTGNMFASAVDKKEDLQLYCRQKEGKKWEDINNRYGYRMHNIVFTGDGSFFFTSSGDLWYSFIEKADADADADPLQYGSVAAYRCAPLASLLNTNSSSPSTGLHDLAISQNSVCADFSRISGNGWGSVVRFKRPAPFTVTNGERQEPPVNEGDWKEVQGIFASIEKVADQPVGTLCASQDGTLTLYTNADSQPNSEVFIIQGEGKPEAVVIQGLGDLLK